MWLPVSEQIHKSLLNVSLLCNQLLLQFIFVKQQLIGLDALEKVKSRILWLVLEHQGEYLASVDMQDA